MHMLFFREIEGAGFYPTFQVIYLVYSVFEKRSFVVHGVMGQNAQSLRIYGKTIKRSFNFEELN